MEHRAVSRAYGWELSGNAAEVLASLEIMQKMSLNWTNVGNHESRVDGALLLRTVFEFGSGMPYYSSL